jgi:hypothetical protein
VNVVMNFMVLAPRSCSFSYKRYWNNELHALKYVIPDIVYKLLVNGRKHTGN